MIKERLDMLLNHNIYVSRKKKNGDFLTLCQKRVLYDRIHSSGIDLSEYLEVSDKIEEAIFRFATKDLTEKKCEQCNSKNVSFISINNGWSSFCSQSCSSKYKVDNGVCWVTKSGWKHTDDTKKKMSENHADFSGENNPFKNKMDNDENFRKEISERKKHYWESLSEKRRKEISEIFSKGQANSNKKSENSHKNHKSGYFYSYKMDKEMFYRSSWELKVCEYLDKKDNSIEEFDIEPFYIEYEFDNEKRYTRIDFYVKYYDGREKIIEVKPSSFLNSGNVPNKIKGCEKYAIDKNMSFVVITEAELKNLEEVLE